MVEFTRPPISWRKIGQTIRNIAHEADEDGWEADATIFERHFGSRPIDEYVDVWVAPAGNVYIFYRLTDSASRVISCINPSGDMRDQTVRSDMMGGLSSNVAQFVAYGLGGQELPTEIVVAGAALLFRCHANKGASACEKEASNLRKAVVIRERYLARRIWAAADRFIDAARAVKANPADLFTIMRIEDRFDAVRPDNWPPVMVKTAKERSDSAIEMLEALQRSNAYRDIIVKHGEMGERVVTGSGTMCPPGHHGYKWMAEVTYSFGGLKFRREEPRGRCKPNDVAQKP